MGATSPPPSSAATKAAGGASFAKGDYSQAKALFAQAASEWDAENGQDGAAKVGSRAAASLGAVCRANEAACALKLSQWTEAADAARDALSRLAKDFAGVVLEGEDRLVAGGAAKLGADADALWAKVYFRLGRALLALDEHARAEAALEIAAALRPGDAAIGDALEEARVADELPPLDDMEETLVKKGIQVRTAEDVRREEAERKASEKRAAEMERRMAEELTRAKAAPSVPAASRAVADDVIRPKSDAASSSPLVLPEVQEMLKDTQGEWMNENLLQAVAGDEVLMRGMQDPRMQAAIEAFQKNPEEAARVYKDNKDVIDFMNRFSRLMGSHFEKLGEEKDKEKQAGVDERAVAAPAPVEPAAQNPEVQSLLMDSDVQAFLALLRAGKNQGKEFMAAVTKPGMQGKIARMMDLGLLAQQ